MVWLRLDSALRGCDGRQPHVRDWPAAMPWCRRQPHAQSKRLSAGVDVPNVRIPAVYRRCS